MSRDRTLIVVRWVVATVLVALLAVAMIRLSQWQWSKHLVRDEQISRVQANRGGGVAPLTDVVRGTQTVDEQRRWRSVRVTGTYDPAHQLVVRLRSIGDQSGFEVLTPLRAADGTVILVDRGLLARPDAAARQSLLPAPPPGTVTITGYLRSPETGGTVRASGLVPVAGVVRAIDVASIAPTLPYPVVDGYLQVAVSDPADSADFVLLPPPSDDPGPYLSYSVQWVIFAVIAVGGLLFLAVDEIRGGRLRTRLRATAPQPAPARGAGGATPEQTSSATSPATLAGAGSAPRPPPDPRPAAGPRRVAVLAGPTRDAALPADFFDDPDEDDPPTR
jgi:cytochrome oxidase assembly protein ShyY1